MWILLIATLFLFWYISKDCKCIRKKNVIEHNEIGDRSTYYSDRSDRDHLENVDRREVDRAMNILYSDQRSIYECSKDVSELVNNAYIISTCDRDNLVEHFTPDSTGDDNTWERFYYSNPFNYHGLRIPEGMYSKLYHWSPGFYNGSGWMYSLRPNTKTIDTTRNRWVRKTVGNKPLYFYINNNV